MTEPIKIPVPIIEGPCRGRRDVEWAPDRYEHAAPAIDICATCPDMVRRACARYALDTSASGVYAGVYITPHKQPVRDRAYGQLAQIAGRGDIPAEPTPTVIRPTTSSAASHRRAALITAVVQLHEEGKSRQTIADTIGVSTKQVSNYLHEYRRLTGQAGTYRRKNR